MSTGWRQGADHLASHMSHTLRGLGGHVAGCSLPSRRLLQVGWSLAVTCCIQGSAVTHSFTQKCTATCCYRQRPRGMAAQGSGYPVPACHCTGMAQVAWLLCGGAHDQYMYMELVIHQALLPVHASKRTAFSLQATASNGFQSVI